MNKKSYQEWLKDPRWIKRRNEILTRDKNTCQFCGAQDKYLHVHHREYFDGFFPWEYPDSDLVTLCEDCHKYIHKNAHAKSIDVEIGQVFLHEHSDYTNTAIVYHVDYFNNRIYTIECDDCAGYDSIYDNVNTYDYFHKKYDTISCNKNETIWLFETWFVYVSDHLEETPIEFRYNYDEIIRRNPYLQEILDNRELYEYRY